MRRAADPHGTWSACTTARVDRTSDGTGVVSELTLAHLRELNFGADGEPAEMLTLPELIALVLDWPAAGAAVHRDQAPGALRWAGREQLLAELHRFGLSAPASADHSRAVVMSFSTAAVWRIRRTAPLLPTVLLGDTSRYLGGSAATTVGATAIGPSIKSLREHPELVDRAAAAGRATYCWTVDEPDDVTLCRDLGVGWIATNHPGRVQELARSVA